MKIVWNVFVGGFFLMLMFGVMQTFLPDFPFGVIFEVIVNLTGLVVLMVLIGYFADRRIMWNLWGVWGALLVACLFPAITYLGTNTSAHGNPDLWGQTEVAVSWYATIWGKAILASIPFFAWIGLKGRAA